MAVLSDVRHFVCANIRYLLKLVLVFSSFSLFIYVVLRAYTDGVHGFNTGIVSGSFIARFKASRNKNLEIWTEPWPVKNSTWAKLKTTRGEVDIMVYPESMDRVVSGNLMKNGSWEPGELLGVERLFKCDPQLGLIDIGANIGLYVLLGAKYGRQVVAVEPSLDNLGRLYASVEKNKFGPYVTLVHNAVSNTYTTMELSANPWNRGNTVILDSKNPDFHVPGEFEVTDRVLVGSVKTIRMDDLLPVVHFSRGILKIDIEGAEQLAFEFSHDFLTLLDIPYIFMEWLWIKQDFPQAAKLYKFFTGLGFRPYKNAQLNVQLNSDYLNWPTDVFWVNIEKTGPCQPELVRWLKEDLHDPQSAFVRGDPEGQKPLDDPRFKVQNSRVEDNLYA